MRENDARGGRTVYFKARIDAHPCRSDRRGNGDHEHPVESLGQQQCRRAGRDERGHDKNDADGLHRGDDGERKKREKQIREPANVEPEGFGVRGVEADDPVFR